VVLQEAPVGRSIYGGKGSLLVSDLSGELEGPCPADPDRIRAQLHGRGWLSTAVAAGENLDGCGSEAKVMNDKSKVLEDLRREVGRIAGGGGAWLDISKPTDFRAYTPAPADSRLREMGRTERPAERGSFGRWLLRQEEEGLRAGLIRAARTDPQFPLDGDPEAVRGRLRPCMAEGDMFEAVDEAELDWLSF
jgi:hypothetical protein